MEIDADEFNVLNDDFVHDVEMSDDELREELEALHEENILEEKKPIGNDLLKTIKIEKDDAEYECDEASESTDKIGYDQLKKNIKCEKEDGKYDGTENSNRLLKDIKCEEDTRYERLKDSKKEVRLKDMKNDRSKDSQYNQSKDKKHKLTSNSYRSESKNDRCNTSDSIDMKRLLRPLDVSKETDVMIVGREMAYRLQEKKMHLIGHVVRVVGFSLAMEMFNETKRIVKNGGLKTDSGDRKRSPGGVFLYILRNRGYASDKQIKEIFKEENEMNKQKKKRKFQSKRVEKRKYLMEQSKK